MASQSLDLVLTDARMPQMSGFELCSALRTKAPALPVLVMTADPPEQAGPEGRAAGARRVLSKPFAVEALAHALREVARSPR